MRLDQPPPSQGPPLARSVAACLAAILELPPAEVPVPDGADPWTVWRVWLGTRGLGLVPVAEPRAFYWPGPWIALVDGAPAGGPVAALAFGAPPGLVWHPLGGDEPFTAVVAGYTVAPHDVALWRPARGAGAPARARRGGPLPPGRAPRGPRRAARAGAPPARPR